MAGIVFPIPSLSQVPRAADFPLGGDLSADMEAAPAGERPLLLLPLGPQPAEPHALRLLQGALREQRLRLLIQPALRLSESLPERPGAVLLLGAAAEDLLPTLRRLRGQVETALWPVLLCFTGPPGDGEVEPQEAALLGADGVLVPPHVAEQLGEQLGHVRALNRALDGLRPALGLSPAGQRCMTLLRYLVTRNLSALAPHPDPTAPLGHRYEPLDPLVRRMNAVELERLVQGGLLRASFYDRVHTCPACGDARLSFREVCGGCGCADVEPTEVIHHYRCGHVGREADFRAHEPLRCPSCGEALRHIGVDYERPARLLCCRGCDLLSAEGVTKARCLACGRSHAADAVHERRLLSYQLTAEGRAAALAGQLPAEERP